MIEFPALAFFRVGEDEEFALSDPPGLELKVDGCDVDESLSSLNSFENGGKMNYLGVSRLPKTLKAAALFGAMLIPATEAMAVDRSVSLTCSSVAGAVETWVCSAKKDGVAVVVVKSFASSAIYDVPTVVWDSSGVNVTHQADGSIQVRCESFTNNGVSYLRPGWIAAKLFPQYEKPGELYAGYSMTEGIPAGKLPLCGRQS